MPPKINKHTGKIMFKYEKIDNKEKKKSKHKGALQLIAV